LGIFAAAIFTEQVLLLLPNKQHQSTERWFLWYFWQNWECYHRCSI